MDTIDYQLVEMLQQAADWFMDQEDESMVDRVSITINSGNRCVTHNHKEGGSKRSRHMKSCAADFKFKYVMHERDANNKQKKILVPPDEVADYLEKKYIGKFGIGRYNGRTHFDTSTGPARRWDVR